jgi:hypothetical protein
MGYYKTKRPFLVKYVIKTEPVIVIERNTHNAFHDLIGMVSFIELASYVLVEHPLLAV